MQLGGKIYWTNTSQYMRQLTSFQSKSAKPVKSHDSQCCNELTLFFNVLFFKRYNRMYFKSNGTDLVHTDKKMKKNKKNLICSRIHFTLVSAENYVNRCFHIKTFPSTIHGTFFSWVMKSNIVNWCKLNWTK